MTAGALRGISVAALVACALLHGPEVRGWSVDQHRWQVSQALEYMERSGNPFLEYVAEWLWWAPGYNTMQNPPERQTWDDPRCVRGDPLWPGWYSAACAMRDEAANTDYKADMGLWVDVMGALGEVADCTLFPPVSPADVIRCITALTALSGASFREIVEQAASLLQIQWTSTPEWPEGPSISLPGAGDLNMTSMNHFVGVGYDSDLAPRDTDGNALFDPDCAQREPFEHRGQTA